MGITVVTGANRGIGLEFCRQLTARGARVLAACRRSSPELDALGVRVLQGVDVSDPESVALLAQEVGEDSVELLVNNAGVMESEVLGQIDFDGIRRQIEVNSLGPLRVTEALLPRLGPGSKVAIVTSLMGSMADNGSGRKYGYRMSKAAVNAAGVSLARDLAPREIPVVLLHPGLVATDMTAGRGMGTDESVRGLLARIDALDLERSGTFWHSDGRALDW